MTMIDEVKALLWDIAVAPYGIKPGHTKAEIQARLSGQPQDYQVAILTAMLVVDMHDRSVTSKLL